MSRTKGTKWKDIPAASQAEKRLTARRRELAKIPIPEQAAGSDASDEPLTIAEEEFAQAVALEGLSYTEAFLRANPRLKRASAAVKGCVLAQEPKIALRIRAILAAYAEHSLHQKFMSMDEKREWLARVKRANYLTITDDPDDPNADLIIGKKYTNKGMVVLEFPDKLKAIALDNDLTSGNNGAIITGDAMTILLGILKPGTPMDRPRLTDAAPVVDMEEWAPLPDEK